MAYSDEQITNYVYQLQEKGATTDDIRSFVQQAKQEQLTAQQSTGQAQGQAAGSAMNQQPQGQQHISPEQAGGTVAKGLMGALSPANFGHNLQAITQQAGKTLASPGIANPDLTGSVPSQEQQQQAEQQNQQHLQQAQKTGQQLNQMGLVPPSQATTQEKQGLLDQAQASMTPGGAVGLNMAKSAQAGLESVGKGAQEVVGGVQQAVGGQGEEGSKQSFQGLEDIVKGGLGTAFSPVSGVIGSIPDEHIKQGITSLANSPGWATSSVAKWAAKLANPNLSDDELEKLVGQPINLATQLYLTKGGAEKAGELSEGIKSAMEKPDMSPQQIALERAAAKAGLPQNDIATIRNLTPEQHPVAMQMLETALRKQNNPGSAPSVWEAPGKEIESFLNDAHGQLRTIGKNMEDAINSDLKGKTVDAAPIHGAFQTILDKMNVGRDSKGNLDFTSSDIAANPTAISGLKKIDSNLNNSGTTTGSLSETMNGNPMDARGLVSINRMINDITGVSKKGGYNSSALSASLSPLKEAVDQIATDNSPLYATAKAEYGPLKNSIDNIEAAGKYGTGKNSGISGQQILQRSLTTAGQKSSDALQSIQDISDNYGVDAPKDLQSKAQLADLMERFSQTKPSRSLGGLMQQGGQIAQKVVPKGMVGQTLSAVGGKIKDIGTDVNYQHFAGKIPGFKDAIESANKAQVQSMFDLISKKDFSTLSPETKFSVLKSIAKSIPDNMLKKIVKTNAKISTDLKKDISE